MRKTFIHSETRNYLEIPYIEAFKEENADLVKGDDESLLQFIAGNDVIQLDVETNVVDLYTERKLYVIQLGDVAGDEQHVIDFLDVSENIRTVLQELFNNREKTFIAHNGKFEYVMIYKAFGIYIYNFQDTFLASKLLTAGLELPKGFNGLKNQVGIRIGVDMDKDEQKTFNGEKMTVNQLIYATTDVLYMGKLLELLKIPLKKWNLLKLYNLERKTLRPIGDFTINGIGADTVALDENIVEFDVAEARSRKNMTDILANESDASILESIKAIKAIQPEDEILINWNSPTQKKLILAYFYPDEEVKSTAVKALEKLEDSVEDPAIITLMLNKNFDKLNLLLVSRHMEFLKKNGMFVAKGTINVNFNSPAQLLALFKIWYPNLTGVGAGALKKLKKSPLIEAYKKNAKASKLKSSFGQKMYDYIGADGRIHGEFSQLVPSGSRASASKPNLQQMPSTESYRRIFVPRKGWKLVDSDYSSAEIYISAYLSKDPNMLYAVKEGYDMHSYSASLIFGDDWITAGGSDKPTNKPTTKEGNRLRKLSKGLSFSLLYGTGVQAFSENMGISIDEGKKLMKKYYGAFPILAAFFKEAGEYVLKHGYIREPFFNRVRFFDKPTNGMEVSHNKNAGMNFQPQAVNGSIMKYAMALMKKYIEDNNLDHKVKLLLFVHDQAVTEVRDDFAGKWAEIQTELMEKAALVAIPSGELKAESMVLEHWTK